MSEDVRDGNADDRWRWLDEMWPQLSNPGSVPPRETCFGDPVFGPDWLEDETLE